MILINVEYLYTSIWEELSFYSFFFHFRLDYLLTKNSDNLFRTTFFDQIDTVIPYPAYWKEKLAGEVKNCTPQEERGSFVKSELEDYSFGVANGEIVSFTIDFQGFVYFY